MVFFQAEDGIRDLVRSRGLGDVYKRQEKGLRAILNFGHTFGHALEAKYKYKKYLHGEAIAIGMRCASKISLELKLSLIHI